MARARTIVLSVLTVEVVVLVLTGVVLYFAYVPTASQAFGPGFPEAEGGELAELLRLVHRWASWLAVPTSIAAATLLAVRARPAERVVPGLVLGVGLALGVLAASFTGFLLPWDHLAVFSVTVGDNLSGYTWLGNEDVRFALMDGTEIAPATLFKWLLLHVVVMGGAVVGLTALGWRRARRRSPIEPAAPAANEPSAEAPVGV